MIEKWLIQHGRCKKLVSILVLLVSAGLIFVGVIMHQPDEVLAKAIKICLECVGIG